MNEKNDSLEHYGVLGMKWGVRKDPKRAVGLANEKLKKLDKKVKKSTAKATKLTERAFERNAKAESAILFKGIKKFRASGASRKASKALARVQANKLKAKRWASNMDKVFSNAKVRNVDKEAIVIGKEYAKMTLEDIAAASLTVNALISSRDRYKTSWNR